MSRTFHRALCVSAAGVALIASALSVSAGEPSAIPMAAGKGLSLDIGNKHTMTYYEQKDGACSVTVVVASREGGTQGDDSPGTRIAAVVMPGTALRIDSSTAQSAEFFCGPGGRRMNARVFDREGYSKERKS